jgi:hypothetical protein
MRWIRATRGLPRSPWQGKKGACANRRGSITDGSLRNDGGSRVLRVVVPHAGAREAADSDRTPLTVIILRLMVVVKSSRTCPRTAHAADAARNLARLRNPSSPPTAGGAAADGLTASGRAASRTGVAGIASSFEHCSPATTVISTRSGRPTRTGSCRPRRFPKDDAASAGRVQRAAERAPARDRQRPGAATQSPPLGTYP